MFKKFILFLILILSGGISWADVTSYDYTFVANDVYSSDFHTRLNANFAKSLTGGINNITAANIKDDSILEADMADEINPRVRTYEGASCEYVYQGLLPTTSANLTSDITFGTAYPKGYRVNKSSSTSHSYTASRWTYVDIDTSGNFQYAEIAIGGAVPAVAANAIRLAKVSTDAATVNTVSDLRRTSCTNGPFDIISDAAGEATLDDVLRYGANRKAYSGGSVPQGLARGAIVSYDKGTSFIVTPGSLFINGKFRSTSQDIIVPITADDPTRSVSGMVSGSPAASTTYKVYAVADEDGKRDFSVSFGTSPAGLTNYREIGQIMTSSDIGFVSRDVVTAHAQDFSTIQTGTVSSAATFTVSNLNPGKQYKLILTMKQGGANGYYYFRFNGDSGGNYAFGGTGPATGAGPVGQTAINTDYSGTPITVLDGYNYFAAMDIMYDPISTNNIYITGNTYSQNLSSGNHYTVALSGSYKGATPVTSVTVGTSAGNMTGAWRLYEIS